MNRILFVDDDRFFGKTYVDMLREHFGSQGIVDVCTKIDDAVHYVHAHQELRAIVLDVMMPPPQTPEYVTHDIAKLTEEGFATGIWYLRLLKAKLIERQVRTFVLTNRDFDQVKVMLAALNFPAGLVECDRKISVPAATLPTRIAALMNRPVG